MGLIPVDHEAKEAEVLPSVYSLKSGRDLTHISRHNFPPTHKD